MQNPQVPEALPEMSEEEQRFVQELHARTEESKSVHFVDVSVLGSNSTAGREARRSDDINVWDYCVVRGDATQGSLPWWIGKVLAVTVENGKVKYSKSKNAVTKLTLAATMKCQLLSRTLVFSER